MAEYISFQPTDFFNPKLYTGTGSSLGVTGVGFQPDLTWIKQRNSTGNHYIADAARGAGKYVEAGKTNHSTEEKPKDNLEGRSPELVVPGKSANHEAKHREAGY